MSLPEMFLFYGLCGQEIDEDVFWLLYSVEFFFLDFKNVKIFPFCSCTSLWHFFFFSSSSHQHTLFFCHLPKYITGISFSVSLLILFHSSIFPVFFKCCSFSKFFFLYVVTSSLIPAQNNFCLNRWNISEEKWELLKIKQKFQNWKV